MEWPRIGADGEFLFRSDNRRMHTSMLLMVEVRPSCTD